MNNSREVPYETLGEDKYQRIQIKLNLPSIEDKEYPKISIVTPLYNRYNFVMLMIRNYEAINYPRHKIEWVILDDSDCKDFHKNDKYDLRVLLNYIKNKNGEVNEKFNEEEFFKKNGEKLFVPNIKYFKLDKHVPLGKKRNLLGKLSLGEYIVHMDDDDFYPALSVVSRIRTLLMFEKNYKEDFMVGCSKVNCFDLISHAEFEAYDSDEYGCAKTISESTMAYSKRFFNKQSFNDNDTMTECLNFMKDRYSFVVRMPSSFVVTQLSHNSNITNRRMNENNYTNNYFLKSLNAYDDALITELKAKVLAKIELYRKILSIVYTKDAQQFFKEYDSKKCEDPDKKLILSNPMIIDFRKNLLDLRSKKHEKGLKRICYYCGPGEYYRFTSTWSPNSKIIGGSEESVINLSNELKKYGYSVDIYAVLDDNFDYISFNKDSRKDSRNDNGVINYYPYWEWIPEEYYDVCIIWRDPTNCKKEINASLILLDLHDYIENRDTFKGLPEKVKIMAKSEFHRNNIKKFVKNNNEIVVIPNGIKPFDEEIVNKKINEEKKVIKLVCTSSPDRCLIALLNLSEKIKKEIKDKIIKIYWAYGFKSGINQGGLEVSVNPVVINYLKEVKEKMNVQENFINLDRLSQKEINDLYLDCDYYVYGTFFPEIDCISMSKAISAGCIPIVTPVGALKEKILKNDIELINEEEILEKLKYSLDKSVSGELFEKWSDKIISSIKNEEKFDKSLKEKIDKNYSIQVVGEKWLKEIFQEKIIQ